MLKLSKKVKGFTLVELMIIVVIIGILSTIAIPNFLRYQARAKQSETKANLGTIYTFQTTYFGENDTYASSIGNLGWSPVGTTRYAYSIIAGDFTHFTAHATSNIDTDTTIDVWEINQDALLTNPTNDVIN